MIVLNYTVEYVNQHGREEVAKFQGSAAVEVFTEAMEEKGGEILHVESSI